MSEETGFFVNGGTVVGGQFGYFVVGGQLEGAVVGYAEGHDGI